MSVATRFWSKVSVGDPVSEDDNCWLFMGSRNSRGYGNFRLDGRIRKAHRVAWFLTYGVWPEMCTLHRCDNPACVNPSHLFSGTTLDNTRDCIAKGRFNPAGKFGPGKLPVKCVTSLPRRDIFSADDVITIRRRCAAGESQSSVARELGVHPSTVCLIVNRRIWSKVQPCQ